MRARRPAVALGLIVFFASSAAEAGIPTGCCLREFTPSELSPTVFCTETTAAECFQFAGVGVVSESFEAGKVCASDGQSCVAAPPPGIDLDIGLGRPPEAPELPGSILIYPAFDSGQPATIRARVINNSGSTLTHATVRIFQGNEELLNDENVPFLSAPNGGFLLDEDTTLPDRSELVGVLVCYATGEMGATDCPEYPTGITGYGERSTVPRGSTTVQVFTALAFGVLLQSGAIQPAPILDAVGLALLAAALMGLGASRQRRRAG